MAVANELASWSGVWKEKEGIIETRRSGHRVMWTDIQEWAENMKTCVSPIDAHQKAPSPEEALRYQVDKMI